MSLSGIDGNYNPLQPDSKGSYEEVEHLLEEEKEKEDDTGAIDYNPFSVDDEQEDLAEEDPQPVAECSKSKRPRCEKLFSFNAVFCQKLFRNQLRPTENSSTRVVGDSIEDVIECLWDTGKDLIKRQVVFKTTWSMPNRCQSRPESGQHRTSAVEFKHVKKTHPEEEQSEKTLAGGKREPCRLVDYGDFNATMF
ncbi:hypothetical protein quinque_014675 [Culex quinquefasciatus]